MKEMRMRYFVNANSAELPDRQTSNFSYRRERDVSNVPVS